MATIAGFPSFEVQFTQDAALLDEGEATQLLDFLAQGTVTDLFVFSHGWNNDMAEARQLNAAFFQSVRGMLARVPKVGQRQFAVLTVLWPSKRFADADLIPGGAASLTPAEVLYVEQQLEDLKALFKTPQANETLDRAKALVRNLDASPAAQKKYADLLRSLLPRPQAGNEDAAEDFFKLPGDELLDRLKAPIMPGAMPMGGPGAQGGAAGFGNFMGNLAQGIGNLAGQAADAVSSAADTFVNRTTAAASNLANLTTYYQMKERAGSVGANGLSPLLARVRQRAPNVKIHLIGHSFGGRLVTAAAEGPAGQPPVVPNSMTLLQAAFSHNGFAQRFGKGQVGFFRTVVTQKKVAGPILISCSIKDKAVGLSYPLASRVAGQQASAIGDANDVYGGIGRNGAQNTPEADKGSLLAVGSPYQFQAGRLYNLHADTIIGGHSDICKDEVAYALLTAVATT